MVKRISFGVVWWFVLYFVACFLVGAVAGAIAGARDPENASVAGAQAGAAAVASYRSAIILGSAALAAVGTWSGVLPGTKRKRAKPSDGA